MLHDCLLDFLDIDAEVSRDCGQRPPGVEHRHHRLGLVSRYHILRRHLHPALEEVGFEKAGNHAFRRFRDTFLRNRTNCPEGVLHFWLGWGTEGMSGHYDQIKNDVAFRKDVVNRCGVGFEVPASLAPIEPKEPKFEAVLEQEVAVTV